MSGSKSQGNRAARTRAGTCAALGFRAHSGWAALVVVAGTPREPVAVHRRRVIIADPAIPGSKQPFHAAEGWPLAKTEEYLNRCIGRTKLMARDAVSTLIASLQESGHSVRGCGILGASGRPLPDIAATLASHALIHTAEGELFRNALIAAGEDCRLPVTRVKEKELFALASEALRTPAEKLQRRITELGKPLGSPWTQDEKLATLVAWMVLAAGQR